MEQWIKDRFNDAILREAAQRYGVGIEQLNKLGSFESYIFTYERDSQGYILRLSHSLRRNESLIEGEADWINYLAEGGVPVAKVVPSERNRLVEAIDDGQDGYFLATAFVKIVGQSPWRVGWSASLYERYGQLLGRAHALSTHYEPPDPAHRRPEWDWEMYDFVNLYLPDSESMVREKYRTLKEHLYSLPKDRSSYGLIHQDAHGSNLMVDEAGNLTLIDFDDCAYSWFINDIAIVLFYLAVEQPDAPGFTAQFMPHFLRGYRQFYKLDPAWLKEIPHFLKLREIELYAVIHRDFDVNNMDNEWGAAFMRGRKQRIEDGVPFIDFDFASLADLMES